jgi:hypothetical protein
MFLCVSLGSSTVQPHYSLGSKTHAHIHRLVSVIKIVTMLEVYNTEEQRSVLRFRSGVRFWMKRSIRII